MDSHIGDEKRSSGISISGCQFPRRHCRKTAEPAASLDGGSNVKFWRPPRFPSLMAVPLLVLLVGFLVSLLGLTESARAGQMILSSAELERWGYKKAESAKLRQVSLRPKIIYEKHSLPFPLVLTKKSDQFGPIMQQYQDYSTPAYYHGGVDIRADLDQSLMAPISGRVEAGYYAYSDEPNGHSVKHFLSLKDARERRGVPPWGPYYFEVAIVDSDGYRFELHHVEPDTLTPSLVAKILSGGSVEKGEYLGRVGKVLNQVLGLDYHHVHYNVVHPNGTYLNPFFLSRKIEDTTPPRIFSVQVSVANPSGCKHGPLTLDEPSRETTGVLVVEVKDYVSGGRFSHPPKRLTAYFGRSSVYSWDFSQSLTNEQGLLPDLRELYVLTYCSAEGALKFGTMRDRFFIKIPVPMGFNGVVTIVAEDQAGNQTSEQIPVKTPAI